MPRKKMKGLTPRQTDVLRVIVQSVEENGRFPTIRDIGGQLGIVSTQPVVKHLDGLVEKGYLRRKEGRLVLADKARPERGLPLLGQVAAGSPILALDHIAERVDLDRLYGEGHFLTRVKGDSMVDAGIQDGDLVVVREQPTLRDGEIGIFFLGEEQEVTIKVFRPQKDGIVLEPRNEAYTPIRIPLDDPYFRIGGKVTGFVRRL